MKYKPIFLGCFITLAFQINCIRMQTNINEENHNLTSKGREFEIKL